MNLRSRAVMTTVIATAVVGLLASPVYAAETGWVTASLANSLDEVNGCRVSFYSTVGSAHSKETYGCSGQIGSAAKYRLYSGSLMYTSGIEWGYTYAKVEAPIIYYQNTYH